MSTNKRKNKKKIDFRYNLSEYWNLLKNYKFWFIGAIFMILLTELTLIVDKFLFKKIIDDGNLFLNESISKNAFIEVLIIIAIIAIAAVIIRVISKWFAERFVHILESNLIFNLKNKYFKHIVKLSHKFHTTHKTGALISRVNRGSNGVEGLTDVILYQTIPLIINLVVVGLALAYFTIEPALVILGISITFIAYSLFIQHIQQRYRLDYNSKEDSEKAVIGDVFSNIDSIKYFGKENVINKLYSNTSNKTKTALRKYWKYYEWFDAGHLLILGIGTFFLIYFPIKGFIGGEITLGTLVFVFTIYGNVIGPLFNFVHGVRGYYRYMADLQDLFQYGKIENDIKDKSNAKRLQIEDGEVEFKNVSFNYGKKKAFSLDKFNLKIKENEKVAFVGHSGCGKTTLLKLLYRLYDVNSGEILIDGKNIKDLKQESLRGELSIVPQECVLFDDTIFNNIKFSNPHASREEVLKAIKFAQLDKVIANFPDKERTIVGERGVKLSGGEKQRVSIARAILANKKVLVLDEATSSLDSETEYDIQYALTKLLKGRTSIIIAHRLSTIMNSDRIIVMKNGKIIQQGTHESLINKEGEYQKLWNLQKGGYVK